MNDISRQTSDPAVRLEIQDGIAWISLNRPERRNALDQLMLGELERVLDQIDRDTSIQVLVLQGAGNQAFAAGADLRELQTLQPSQAHRRSLRGQALTRRLEQYPFPTLAAVSGWALGGGCELALACHIRVACQSARFGFPEVGLGLIPAWGGTQRLPRIVGLGNAMDLILTGQWVDAETALRMGLISRVFPDEEFDARTEELVQVLRSRSTTAQRHALQALRTSQNPGERGFRLESALYALLAGKPDWVQRIQDFLA